ncbi:MAG: hypothetical protein K2L51_07305, partial [Clostridiales bacterium]|nr:hypothetical protein [Clostridiales bacterium]
MMQKATRKNYWIISLCLLAVFICNTGIWGGSVFVAGAQPLGAVFVGGFPIGLELKPRGVIVVGAAAVETELGNVVTQDSPLRNGDVIESINGREIHSAADIAAVLADTDKMTADVCVRRGTATLRFTVGLIREDMTCAKRLGLQIRESIMGVGTVTYVKEDGSFGCLGHPITLENGNMAPCEMGACYDCKILGCNKGVRGKAGELKGAFVGNVPIGSLQKNCRSGVYGHLHNYAGGERVEVMGRKGVRVGKASILTTIGDTTETYSIEIVKTSVQNTASDKSMIVRVTDKRLLAATGGIVQGMSGSPI